MCPNFTPPTAPLTAVANTQLLTLQHRQPHNNHTFQDSSSNNFLITRSGNATQGTFSPFSQAGWSVLFTGSTDIALNVTTGTGVAFGTGDFCQEFFVYPNSFPTNWRIISYPSSAVASILQSGAGGGLGIDIGGGIVSTGYTLTIGVWSHIVFTRQSGVIRVFVDGILRYNVSNTTNYSTSQNVYIGGFPGFTQSWDGYISNARIIKGSVPAAYQTSSTTNGATIFTSPSSPLSSVTGTELLLCQSNRFIDTNTQTTAKTIAIQGSPKIQAFSPYAATATYSAATHGGSAYFDGSGDYLTLPTGSAFAPGTGDFTIDGWFYPQNTDFMLWSQTISGTNYFILGLNAAGTTFGFTATTSGGGSGISGPANITLNSWNYFSVRRASGIVTVYTNGSSGTPVSNTMDINNTTYVPTIGRYTHAAANIFTGYISNLRYVKGTAIAPSSVPTTPSTAVSGTSALLNFTNDAIEDATGRNVIEIVGDARTTSAVAKWAGQTSMYFDGTGDYAVSADTLSGNFGTGDFTVEYWFRCGTQSTSYVTQVGTLDSGSPSGSWRFGTQLGTAAGVYLAYHTGTSFVDVTFTTTNYNDNTWRYAALTRSGTTVRAFIDGVQVGSNQTISQNFSARRIVLGAELTTPTYYVGYLQDVRVTRGYARYTSNFTPPTGSPRLK
ncbi:hypothetical protein EBU95_19200 [bacterium]|nr:hypothetical protein [bacterium]